MRKPWKVDHLLDQPCSKELLMRYAAQAEPDAHEYQSHGSSKSVKTFETA